MALFTSQSEKKRQQEMAAISQKVKKTKLGFGDLIIPIASGAVFIILSFAVFVPMAKSAFEYLDEIKVTQEKIDQLDKVDKQLNKLEENQLNEDVLTARLVIPKILLVSDLVYYLDGLATSLELNISELSSSDSINGVTGPLEYSGAYDKVIAFLDDAQNVSPYMLRLENVEVSAREDEQVIGGTWSISLQISGYYMAEEELETNIYGLFQPYTEYNDIVEIFRKKAESLN